MIKIEKVVALSVGTTAVDCSVHGMTCLVQNLSDSACVYLKEKRSDGVDVTASNGWCIPAGGELPFPMAALDLSLIADDDDTDVRVLILDEV